MAQLTIVVCDVCGELDRHTTRYRLARGTELPRARSSSHFDLCEEHAVPLEDIIATKAQHVDPLPLDPDAALRELTRRSARGE